jgi:hypothetical protein
METEYKKKLVAALRSGEYMQRHNKLKVINPLLPEGRNTTFCAMGVACQIAVKEGKVKEQVNYTYPKTGLEVMSFGKCGETNGAPPEVIDLFGFDCRAGNFVIIDGKRDTLIGHNDNGKSFNQIADAIEAQL